MSLKLLICDFSSNISSTILRVELYPIFGYRRIRLSHVHIVQCREKKGSPWYQSWGNFLDRAVSFQDFLDQNASSRGKPACVLPPRDPRRPGGPGGPRWTLGWSLLHFWTMLGFQPIQWTFLLYILNINAKSMENGDIYRIYSNETCDIDECRPQWYCCKYFHSIEQPVAWAALSWKWLVVCFDIELCKLLLVTFRLFTFCYFQLILVTFSFKLIIPLVIILVTFSFSDTAVAILSDTCDIGLSEEKSTKYVCVGVERCSAVDNFVSSCEKQQQSYQFKTNLISSKYCAHWANIGQQQFADSRGGGRLSRAVRSLRPDLISKQSP